MSEKQKRSPEEIANARRESLAKARAIRLEKIKQQKEDEMAQRTMKLVHAFEMLDAIEKATGDKKVELLKLYGAKAPLSFLLSLNYRSDIVLEIPEGLPPTLKPDEVDTVTHPDMLGQLASSVARLKNCVKENPIKKFQKEKVFIDVMLSCPWKDAEILCACKDKALVELFPSVTKELVQSVFPAYVK